MLLAKPREMDAWWPMVDPPCPTALDCADMMDPGRLDECPLGVSLLEPPLWRANW